MPKQRQKYTMNLNITQFCYIGFGLGSKYELESAVEHLRHPCIVLIYISFRCFLSFISPIFLFISKVVVKMFFRV